MLEAIAYILMLGVWSALVAYWLLFSLLPSLGKKHDAGHGHHAPVNQAPRPLHYARPTRDYSTHEGFKSLANQENLSVEDIVKGLSREKH